LPPAHVWARLGRDVAIKILPEAFAHDPKRLARFQREAKMLASLNHPNIATIHGLELVSGEILAEHFKREGALPIEQALKIASQIAEALEAAHEKGIIHRDLKPANVKVTPEGKVKVLGFGYMTVQLQVFSLIDHTHAAATELFQDAIVRDGLADHAFIFPVGTRCINSPVFEVKGRGFPTLLFAPATLITAREYGKYCDV
jgi:serine/threonine protein kinase